MVTALIAYPNTNKVRLAAWLVLHGSLIKVLEYFSGYKYGDWQDAAADGFGVQMGLALVAVMKKISRSLAIAKKL